MRTRSAITAILLLLAALGATAQVNIRDSSIFSTVMYATYAYQIPSGDLSKIFGGTSSIGGGVLFKTKSNWLFGAEGNFLFGQSVRNGDSLLRNIMTHDGFLIDDNGFYADIVYYQRGYSIMGRFGKIIPLLAPNPNCGFTLLMGAGYIQDKIRIHNPGNTAPQILGDYKKGYDRLNGGIALSGSVGYTFLSNTRLLNFGAAFEFMQTWTNPYRERNFDTGMKDTRKFSTQFYSLRVYWMIPLYRRAPKEFYYY